MNFRSKSLRRLWFCSRLTLPPDVHIYTSISNSASLQYFIQQICDSKLLKPQRAETIHLRIHREGFNVLSFSATSA